MNRGQIIRQGDLPEEFANNDAQFRNLSPRPILTNVRVQKYSFSRCWRERHPNEQLRVIIDPVLICSLGPASVKYEFPLRMSLDVERHVDRRNATDADR